MVAAFSKLNCYFSFSGSILHIPKHAAALRAVPEERLLIETDSPDQLPRPLRGGFDEDGEAVERDEQGLMNVPRRRELVSSRSMEHHKIS